VDELIAQAEKQRPDLAAARSTAIAAERHVASARSELWPTLGGAAGGSRTYFGGGAASSFRDLYSVGLSSGSRSSRGSRSSTSSGRPRPSAGAAEAAAASVEQLVIQQVWAAYYSVQTAAQRIRTSRDLVASARQSADVTRGRYTAGVGSILDLLNRRERSRVGTGAGRLGRADFLFSLATARPRRRRHRAAVKEAP